MSENGSVWIAETTDKTVRIVYASRDAAAAFEMEGETLEWRSAGLGVLYDSEGKAIGKIVREIVHR